MKTYRLFILVSLCLLFFSRTGQAQVLNQKISLTVKDATLPQVLQKIQRKYAVRFSYLNSALPAEQLFSAEIKDKPLSEVLDVLLFKTDIGYLEKNGQVIIKKGLPRNPPKTSTFKKLPPAPEPNPRTVAKARLPAEVKQAPTQKPTPTPATEAPAREKETPPEKTPAATPAEKAEEKTLASASPENAGPVTPPVNPETPAPPADTSGERRLKISFKKLSLKNLFLKKPWFPNTFEGDSLEVRPTHFGLIFPLSTHGIDANRYVNRFSAHLIAGTAAGSRGFEFAGVGNLDQRYVRGFQFAGVYNIARNGGRGGPFNGGYSLQGGQFAGLVNVAAANSTAGQVAGFLNVAKNITGVQVAGFMNQAQTVQGAQIGGFLNRARSVKGVQIGFINLADSLQGIPIGLISIVKHNGYRRLELYHADDFDANVIYKIGVPHFYNILALGAELEGARRWGYGAGFGAEWALTKTLRLNTDLMTYNVIERSYEKFPAGILDSSELNLLNKFRLLATLQLGKHLALFGGPVYNVFVSEHQEAGETEVGSTLAPRSFYNRTASSGVNVKMWIGFNAGIRF